ncbi:membrane progestin receptor epsilon isoform X5 [Octodon degus]|nr:membrane progestin receptor epsilon isoform X5 [Octodon degus]
MERLLGGAGPALHPERRPRRGHKGSDGRRGLPSAQEPAPEVACARSSPAPGTMPRRLQPRGAGTKGTTAAAPGATRRSHPAVPEAPPASAKLLLRWDEVPDDFVECFILSGYRRLPCTAQECLASVLKPTNETLNFWTHFIPLLLFLSKFCRLFFLSGRDVPFHHPWLLPLWCYASGVLLTFAMSCTAHVFSCLSLRLRAAFFYLDYASISYYGFGSTVAYYYYLLPGLSLLDASVMTPYVQQRLGWHVDCTRLIAAYRELVLPVAFVLAVACTVACCKSRTDWCAYPFALRTFVFIMPLSMACPIMLESWLFDLRASTTRCTTWRRVYASSSRPRPQRPPSRAPWATCCCWWFAWAWSSGSSSTIPTSAVKRGHCQTTRERSTATRESQSTWSFRQGVGGIKQERATGSCSLKKIR